MKWSKSPVSLIAIAVILLIASGVLIGVARNIQSSTIGHEANHYDPPADASVVSIEGREILTTQTVRELHGRILNNTYQEHYKLTGIVERNARYSSDLKRTEKDSYTFQIVFLPSNTEYHVDFTITDPEENNFTISVKRED